MGAMIKLTAASLLLATLVVLHSNAAPSQNFVDTTFPYEGPDIPVGDWVDPTVNGNGKGFQRLVESPAVTPKSAHVTNNINVISLSYIPAGMNVHFQTPFGLGVVPSIRWGLSRENLEHTATGSSKTIDRTPPCSLVPVTQCSQFFHDIQIKDLSSNTVYYYQIEAANGTTPSDVLSFTTAREAGDRSEFTIGILNDMGYTNAQGTHQQLMKAVADNSVSFLWHGGDISYADEWAEGIMPCDLSDNPVCYNGTSSELPGGIIDDPEYLEPLPKGEIANQGSPRGGDASPIYETNWDVWQQFMSPITTQVPYMVLPGNHEATCSGSSPGSVLTAYLDEDKSNSTTNGTSSYYSCPPSQRNFTAFSNRFRMPGEESGGVDNFWYSFDYGLVHFVSLDTETDFVNSPEAPFFTDLTGNETHPTEAETSITNSGPFGTIDGSVTDNTAYEQFQWLKADLAAVDRTKTPWILINGHRPMYSSLISGYQAHIRTAFEQLMLDAGVDVYIAGHIHWYERHFPLTINGTVDTSSIKDNNTYVTNEGVSMTHLVNGMAGNVESHDELDGAPILNITAVLDAKHYGFSKLTVNATALKFQFILGIDGSIGDEMVILKQNADQEN